MINKTHSLSQVTSLALIFFVCLCCFGISPVCAREKKGDLIMVADSTLTYASYLFNLPPDWAPLEDEDVLSLTHMTGFWVGRHKDENALFRIMPYKKEAGETISDYMDVIKLNALRDPNCAMDAVREYYYFNPQLDYPYQVSYFDNCPQNVCALLVFLDLPTHVVAFALEVEGINEESIRPYMEDFRSLLLSFKWVFGLSNEEVDGLAGESHYPPG